MGGKKDFDLDFKRGSSAENLVALQRSCLAFIGNITGLINKMNEHSSSNIFKTIESLEKQLYQI